MPNSYSTNPHNPLTDQHYAQVQNAMQQIVQAEAQIAMAKQAGIDVSQQEASLNDSKNKLIALRRVYFPNA